MGDKLHCFYTSMTIDMLLVAAWSEMYGALSLETPAFVGVSVGRLYLAINLRRRDVPLSPCLRVQLQCSARVPKLGGGYRHRRDEPQLQLEGWDGSGVSAAAACLTLKMVPPTNPLSLLLTSTHWGQLANF